MISLHQYDKSPLTIAGEFQANVKINRRVIQTNFVVVEVEKQLPLLGIDLMTLLQFDVVTQIEQVTQVHHTAKLEDTMANKIMIEFADVFNDELGLLKGIQTNVTVDEAVIPPIFIWPTIYTGDRPSPSLQIFWK